MLDDYSKIIACLVLIIIGWLLSVVNLMICQFVFYAKRFSWYFWHNDIVIRPLVKHDAETLQSLLKEILVWVKNPDHDRVFLRTWVSVETVISNVILKHRSLLIAFVNKSSDYIAAFDNQLLYYLCADWLA